MVTNFSRRCLTFYDGGCGLQANFSSVNLLSISRKALRAVIACSVVIIASAQSIDVKQTASYRRIKAVLDATPAIDTHDHLPPFERIAGRVQTERGPGVTL